MTLIEKLKVRYKERYFELHDIDDWHEAIDKAWPKLLAVVEAAERARKTLMAAYYTDELEDVCDGLNYAFDQLEDAPE